MPEKRPLNPLVKFALDLGPILVFVVVNARPAWFAPLLTPFLPPELLTGERAGIFTATGIFIPAVLLALIASYVLTRHLPVMPVVTAIIVVVFGGLTLVL